MGWFILAIILWLCVLVLIFAALFGSGKTESGMSWRAVFTGLAVLSALLGLGLFALGGVKSVPVKNIGVPVAFGAVQSDFFQPGMHETWEPWLNVVHVDETVHTTTFEPGGNMPGTGTCQGSLPVRIGGQQTACAHITIQWKVLPQAAGTLYSDYANQGNLMDVIENAVVVRELRQVVNQVMGDYNPITDVANVTNTNSATSQFTAFGPQILAQMRADIGSVIDVTNLQLPYVQYSDQVEGKLQQIQQAYANFAIAQENVKVNAEQAAAYAKLGEPTLNQLISECLTSTIPRPVGFNCFPGAGSGLAISAGK